MEVHGSGTQLVPNALRFLQVANHPPEGACWNSNPTDVKDGSVMESVRLLGPYLRSCHTHDLDDVTYPYRELFTLRHPKQALLRRVALDGRPWKDFDTSGEWVRVSVTARGLKVVAYYS